MMHPAEPKNAAHLSVAAAGAPYIVSCRSGRKSTYRVNEKAAACRSESGSYWWRTASAEAKRKGLKRSQGMLTLPRVIHSRMSRAVMGASKIPARK